MKQLKYFLPLLVFLLLGFFLLRGIGKNPEELPSPLIGQSMPEFSLVELQSGKSLDVSVFHGKATVLNVWATWCVSCRIEHPYLLELSRQGIHIAGINYKDDPAAARDWLRQLGNPYAFNIVDADGRLGLDLGVFGAPETYLLDAKGIIRYKHVGVIDARVWQELAPIYQNLHD